MEKLIMERLGRILGGLGFLLILAGAVTYGILYTSGWAAFMPLLIGLALSITSFVISYSTSRSEGFKRSTRLGLGTGLSVIIVLALFIFFQILSDRHNIRSDLTRNKRFSLSPQTTKVLAGIDSSVEITCFFKETSEKAALKDLLAEYTSRNPKISFLFYDPDKDPVIARRFGVSMAGVVFIESGDMRQELDNPTEEKITNALARIISGGRITVCFTTGHGEKSINEKGSLGLSVLKEALQLENFVVRELVALGEDMKNEDCDILIIAGPEKDIVKTEQNIILDYLTAGGRALFLVDPMTDIPNITGIAAAFGIDIGKDVIIDRYGKLLAGNFLTPVVNKYGDHPITEGFRHFSFFPQARSVTPLKNLPESIRVTTIGSTTEGAYSESDLKTLLDGQTQYEPSEDEKGPVDLAVASEMEVYSRRLDDPDDVDTDETSLARVVFFGDSDFTGNSNLKLSGNRDLVLNAVNWLAEKEDLISIRPVDELSQPVLLSATQGRFVFWLPVIAMPSIVAFLGFVLVIRKRRSD
jgi:ABC-type uncharacterized transport system involved in gliding motility auxiliary subunit